MIWNDPNQALKIPAKGKAKYLHKGDEIPPGILSMESIEKFKKLGKVVEKSAEREDKKPEKVATKKVTKK